MKTTFSHPLLLLWLEVQSQSYCATKILLRNTKTTKKFKRPPLTQRGDRGAKEIGRKGMTNCQQPNRASRTNWGLNALEPARESIVRGRGLALSNANARSSVFFSQAWRNRKVLQDAVASSAEAWVSSTERMVGWWELTMRHQQREKEKKTDEAKASQGKGK